ncbi:hypothetical protein MRX96_007278 [Rhipicephalus microplus]
MAVTSTAGATVGRSYRERGDVGAGAATGNIWGGREAIGTVSQRPRKLRPPAPHRWRPSLSVNLRVRRLIYNPVPPRVVVGIALGRVSAEGQQLKAKPHPRDAWF